MQTPEVKNYKWFTVEFQKHSCLSISKSLLIEQMQKTKISHSNNAVIINMISKYIIQKYEFLLLLLHQEKRIGVVIIFSRNTQFYKLLLSTSRLLLLKVKPVDGNIKG